MNYILNNMKSRLGFPSEYDVKHTSELKRPDTAMNVLLKTNGGYLQQERMIFDKLRSLDRAVKYSYQGANIQKLGRDVLDRVLINPNKVKQDYDEKVLSARKEYGYAPGDIFEWKGTGTYWICYLQDLTELAYFRSQIRKCQYELVWQDEEGNVHSSYAAIRGPVETQIQFIQKHKTSIDEPNHSLNILMPKNEETLKYFKRYSRFYLRDTNKGATQICWRVEAIDWISMPGILEVNAEEYYANKDEDILEENIADAFMIPISPNEEIVESSIEGETFIKPYTENTYTCLRSMKDDSWLIKDFGKLPLTIIAEDNRSITIKWTTSYSGQFILSKGECEKTIVVQSLF